MKKRGRTIGWLSVLSLFVWIWYDYQGNVRKAIVTGWVSIGLTFAHIFNI